MVERTFSLDGSGTGDDEGTIDNLAGTGDSSNAGPVGEFGAFTLGSGNDDGDGFNPDIHVGRNKRNANGEFTRKRGRRAGNSAAGGSKKGRAHSPDLSASIDALSGVLFLVHGGLASFTKVPEVALETSEATSLATGIANVMEQYDLTPDPKVTAWVGLIMTASAIYGPRMYIYRERKREERKNKKTNGPEISGDNITFFSASQPMSNPPFGGNTSL